jgi:hypothetical protein
MLGVLSLLFRFIPLLAKEMGRENEVELDMFLLQKITNNV